MSTTSPLLPLGQGPRVIVYHQTHHGPNNGPPISLLPLITNATGVTHVIIAAIHINSRPEDLTLNDTSPSDEKFNILWGEVAWLQSSGIKVLGMLGGFAKGSFERLCNNTSSDGVVQFEAFYLPLRDMIRQRRLDGLDLDIEEPTSLAGTIRLIDRLRADFGPDFLITLAPVATALLPGQPHLSGPEFDYRVLEQLRGEEIAWYNTQLYCGWGDAGTTAWYDAIIRAGWNPEKVVMGLISNPSNGPGHIEWSRQEPVLQALRTRYPTFGGVMCWEFFNALPGGLERPWEWAANMARTLRTPILPTAAPALPPTRPPYYGGIPQLPQPAHNFPAESIKTLKELGFSEQQAVAALNSTGGNVEYAAGLLFQD
ncbi:glycoside hydrolase family 18 protein [Sphaerulina musiva SO2202]|uniref:chitinase n=1 Tax=Sphaerulina musiva (strain SO2202) TaxID=692275 RepID=N1QMT1_SPHMS|nr:glycoside hydrolase family 18 protein [Sphaerulina musiva SO2202]EMF17682.1 glycoside hydrolase family 18 protein [Sphaerulina musiva SO2202]